MAGFLGGLVAGTLVWSRVRHAYRRQLFGRSPMRRFVALTYLASRPTLVTARLLHDYLRWEKHAVLRKHALRVLQRVEAHLGRAA